MGIDQKGKEGVIRSVKEKKSEIWSDEKKVGVKFVVKRIPSSLQSGHCRRTRSLSLSHEYNIRKRE
ncbi:heme d1 biosynthesis radical SAM protein NirJ1 [Sesbania bispinosa]|nr:heme d1 biosynthesis radical SAM protein NirJ1 [Sesbania bispinosa]